MLCLKLTLDILDLPWFFQVDVPLVEWNSEESAMICHKKMVQNKGHTQGLGTLKKSGEQTGGRCRFQTRSAFFACKDLVSNPNHELPR